LATRPECVGQWSQAGGIAHYGFAGIFWKSIPREDWPTDDASLAFIQAHWQEPFGDMRQELVFIGQGLDQTAMTNALNACLLSDQDLNRGAAFWASLSDPFPAWDDD
jgi:G3E family GTPase